MPKFYKQNKKRIDPRYFLNETILKEQDDSLQEQKQEYTSAQGQAPYTDGNMKTSVAAAKRRAIKALRAKGAKGPACAKRRNMECICAHAAGALC